MNITGGFNLRPFKKAETLGLIVSSTNGSFNVENVGEGTWTTIMGGDRLVVEASRINFNASNSWTGETRYNICKFIKIII